MHNSLSEESFHSVESGSHTPATNAEDSGIDDRSGSIEKVRLQVAEERSKRPEEPVAVSSPTNLSTQATDAQEEDSQPSIVYELFANKKEIKEQAEDSRKVIDTKGTI